MQKPLIGMKAALLVANGFNEGEMTTFQRSLLEAGATPRIISVENGLAHGWQDNGWGHYFAVDCPLADALAADYDILVIPGGMRSLDKLKLTAHSRRFIGGFMAAGKPVMALNDAAHLMAHTGHIQNYTVTGADNIQEECVKNGATWSNENLVVCENLVSAKTGEGAQPLLDIFSAFVDTILAARADVNQAA